MVIVLINTVLKSVERCKGTWHYFSALFQWSEGNNLKIKVPRCKLQVIQKSLSELLDEISLTNQILQDFICSRVLNTSK